MLPVKPVHGPFNDMLGLPTPLPIQAFLVNSGCESFIKILIILCSSRL
jgi:hypothetical protein